MNIKKLSTALLILMCVTKTTYCSQEPKNKMILFDKDDIEVKLNSFGNPWARLQVEKKETTLFYSAVKHKRSKPTLLCNIFDGNRWKESTQPMPKNVEEALLEAIENFKGDKE